MNSDEQEQRPGEAKSLVKSVYNAAQRKSYDIAHAVSEEKRIQKKTFIDRIFSKDIKY